MIKAGNFEIEVWDPYPCWINLSYENKWVIRFSHKELSDLKYAVDKAMQEAKLLLKRSNNEDEV